MHTSAKFKGRIKSSLKIIESNDYFTKSRKLLDMKRPNHFVSTRLKANLFQSKRSENWNLFKWFIWTDASVTIKGCFPQFYDFCMKNRNNIQADVLIA